MMRGRVEPSAMPTVVRAMPTMAKAVPTVVQEVRLITKIPQMTSP
jgi:hypothetical protein